jgi:CBS domain-containing protein
MDLKISILNFIMKKQVKNMLVCEIMNKKIITVNSNQTILDAFKIYRDTKVGSLVVMENNQLVGIVTERDLIEKAIDKDLKSTLIKEIMTSNVVTISPLDKLETALKIMKKNRVKKLPVISCDKLKGIVTITDIAYARPELSRRFIESWIKPRWED